MNRRQFLAGLTATTAGLLVPERKVWALDGTMIPGTDYYLVDRYVDPSEWYDIRAMGQNADGSTWFNAGVTGYNKIPIGPITWGDVPMDEDFNDNYFQRITFTDPVTGEEYVF